MAYQYLIPAIFFAFALAEIMRSRFFRMPHEKNGDKYVEIISTVLLIGLVQPLTLLLAGKSAAYLLPSAANSLAETALVLQVALLIVCDDMVQYWWHRASHTFPWLYGLHRAHHNADYMSIRIVYRNNLFYYALMPSLWLSGLLIYLGLGPVYVVYIVVKMAVIYGAHSNVRWDEKLYKIKALSPIMWLLEHTISTPATHAAHHGKYKADPATHYTGNFGNLFFFWDVLFGTAKITRGYPQHIGVENLAPMSAGAQLLWPFIHDKTSPTEEITEEMPEETGVIDGVTQSAE